MRPAHNTPVHRTSDFAELVCSNSLKSLELSTPHGLLKEEMRALDSKIIACAIAHRVPAGGALAVDREQFAASVTAALTAHPRIEILREEVVTIPDDAIVILAVGPMVSESLQAAIGRFTGQDYLHFFDAIAPVVESGTIDRAIAFAASRYGKGNGADYLNCPMTRDEYEGFVEALRSGEKAPLHDFDATPFFEGCLPIEEMARRGIDTLRFGPMKPVGLIDPRTGTRPHAVVQLRQDNLAAEHYSMVGFQTQLRWPEQKRIFTTIPGLRGGGVRSARTGAPQLLHQRSARAASHDANARARHTPVCRTDLGSRGVHGVGRDGTSGWNQCRTPHRRTRTGRSAGGHHDRRAHALHRVGGPVTLSADERGIRPAPRGTLALAT
jgi:methylenetetrahydrofolate--tRNA-(uracil-5-)-methyltransferase